MKYIVPAFVALAISASAAPHQWHFPSGFPTPLVPAPGASGLIPTGSGFAFPTGTGVAFPTRPGVAFPTRPGVAFPTRPGVAFPTGTGVAFPIDTGYRTICRAVAAGDGEEEESSISGNDYNAACTVTSGPSVPTSGASSGGGLPAPSGTSALSAVQTIAAGESFDGGMVIYDRGVECGGQSEGGDNDAVFILEAGASISNVIIGPNQAEGIHCFGGCNLTNVWWSAVCEDAFTIKEQDAGATTTITGGGAFGANDKVLQHNGGGTLSVSGFTVKTFGKLYRSCGNCDEVLERHVILDDIAATDGKALAGINSNYGDTATLTNIKASGVSDICVEYEGNDTGAEPEETSSGPSDSCIYSTSDVTSS